MLMGSAPDRAVQGEDAVPADEDDQDDPAPRGRDVRVLQGVDFLEVLSRNRVARPEELDENALPREEQRKGDDEGRDTHAGSQEARQDPDGRARSHGQQHRHDLVAAKMCDQDNDAEHNSDGTRPQPLPDCDAER
jgi:hypothetical protein